MTPLPLAVVGAGFSGTVTALQLIARVPHRRVLLCERGPSFARGAAYSTDDPVHLLNVRAANMSAFADRPNHFTDWLASFHDIPARHLHDTECGLFVSRAIYGQYLATLIQKELACADGASRLRIVPEEVVEVRRRSDASFDLVLAGGRVHQVAGVVVAVGNLGAVGGGEAGVIVRDPWSVRFSSGLIDGEPVVVIGTGLTMVDVVTSLWVSGFSGPVVAISRRGLIPRTHVPPAPWQLSDTNFEGFRSLTSIMRLLRQEAKAARLAGLPWQSVMDAIRPFVATIWRSLSASDQSRFVRHLRPWWDIHRHRIAPPVAQQLKGLVKQGYLRVLAGQISSVTEANDRGAEVSWRARGEIETSRIRAQRVIYATGAATVSSVGHKLVGQLIGSGLARVDTHGLGLDVTSDFQLVGDDGCGSPGLWAIGPLLRGSFWECTAVPDIRNDAERLARTIATSLTERRA